MNLRGRLSLTLDKVSAQHQALPALPPENSPSIPMTPNLGYEPGHLGVRKKN